MSEEQKQTQISNRTIADILKENKQKQRIAAQVRHQYKMEAYDKRKRNVEDELNGGLCHISHGDMLCKIYQQLERIADALEGDN